MANKSNVLSETINGRVFKCTSCNKLHVEYKNLCFNLKPREYEYFKKYFLTFDIDYWESHNASTIYRKKLLIPIGSEYVTAVFDREEILEMRMLMENVLKKRSKYTFVNADNFIAKLSAN